MHKAFTSGRKKVECTRVVSAGAILRWILVAILALAFLSTTIVRAETVEGTVKDTAGNPVAGASVTARNEARGLSVTVISREGGRYTIFNLPPGEYAVRCEANGLQSDAFKVAPTNAGQATANLVLANPADFKKTASMAEFATLMPNAEAKTIIISLCTDCHMNGLQEILFSRKTRDDWSATIEKMRNRPYGYFRSVRISDAQKSAVADYLTHNYGPAAPPLDLNMLPKVLIKGAAAKAVVTQFDLPAGAATHDLGVDSNGVAWIGEMGHGVIGRFDPRSLRYDRIPIPGHNPHPNPLFVDRQGHIWIGDGGNFRLMEYDPKANAFAEYPVPKPSKGVVQFNTFRFQSDGTVWITEIEGNKILQLDPATKKVTEHPLPVLPGLYADQTDMPPGENPGLATMSGNPYGMAIDNRQKVWFAEAVSEKVGRIDPETGKLSEYDIPQRGAGLTRLRRMAADSQGDIWFGMFGETGRLGNINPNTGKIAEYPTPTKYSGAYSVDVDRVHDFVWVDEMMADQIARFDPRTKTFVEYRMPTRNASVRRIEVDPTRPKRVWVAGYNRDFVAFVDVPE